MTTETICRGDLIEVVRSTPTATSSNKIEFVRTQPRSLGEPQVASRFGRPNATTGDELASCLRWRPAVTVRVRDQGGHAMAPLAA